MSGLQVRIVYEIGKSKITLQAGRDRHLWGAVDESIICASDAKGTSREVMYAARDDGHVVCVCLVEGLMSWREVLLLQDGGNRREELSHTHGTGRYLNKSGF